MNTYSVSSRVGLNGDVDAGVRAGRAGYADGPDQTYGVRVATKDTYKAMKAKVTRWASSKVAALEKTPESGARQAVLAEIIDNRPKEDQQAARELAEAVLKHLEGGKQMSLLQGITLLQPAGM